MCEREREIEIEGLTVKEEEASACAATRLGGCTSGDVLPEDGCLFWRAQPFLQYRGTPIQEATATECGGARA